MKHKKQRVLADLKELTDLAYRLGASAAGVISTRDISIEDDLANLCKEPGCENYGLSASCPPHVSGASGFRGLLKNFEQAVVFKVDVPSETLLSSDRREVFRTLHEIAASIEHTAVEMGYHHARAYAGGSCKKLFCQDHACCRVLHEGGECRNPHRARPSMSGFGINVSRLMQLAGWTMNRVTQDVVGDKVSMGTVCGLVLIG